ncbi:hypothetical protein [Alkanindiges illinoisensis]|uniref:hypothetical protein n=1 Tax=Alkanindiges illinoisensis TaxID=197183 RepID=UPI0004791CC9|nr:hypothetical protein [Alkanindiges illinoisensis]
MDSSKHTLRPSYKDATPEQLAKICNGVGPSWAPAPIRKAMTMLSDWFFNSASWQHHDFGYYIGCTEEERAEYDRKFFEAMLIDCRQLPWHKKANGYSLSCCFYASVRVFGRASFYYGQDYQPL